MTINPDYASFLAGKVASVEARGLQKIPKLAPHLFGFQRHCVEHHLRVGSAGCFLDTGLGKTEVQLEFCQKAIEATNTKALIWTPLAVAGQTKRRAEKWGYEARIIRQAGDARPGINICNYDRREIIDTAEFGVVSCDEASILKSFTGKTTRALIEAHSGARFKLVATATPAPNDHMELGNYAEFCEIMAANEMLSRFFINDTSTASQEWRLIACGPILANLHGLLNMNIRLRQWPPAPSSIQDLSTAIGGGFANLEFGARKDLPRSVMWTAGARSEAAWTADFRPENVNRYAQGCQWRQPLP